MGHFFSYLKNITVILVFGKIVYAFATQTFDGTKYTECEPYKTKSGLSCYPCQAGFSKVNDCVEEGLQAQCAPCRNGTYQNDSCSQASHCDPCSTECPLHHMEIVEICTSTSDIECRCIEGYYRIKPENGEKNDGLCPPHKPCPPGEGVEAKGTRTSNVKCGLCSEGINYSNVSSSTQACVICTDCEAIGLQTLKRCTVNNDSICGKTESSDQTGIIIGSSLSAACVIVILVLGAVLIRWRKSRTRDLQLQGYKSTILKRSWNIFLYHLTEKIAWLDFQKFFRHLMWELSEDEHSNLSQEKIDAYLKNKREDHKNNIQEGQYQLLLIWIKECNENQTSPNIEWIKRALQKTPIEVNIVDSLLYLLPIDEEETESSSFGSWVSVSTGSVCMCVQSGKDITHV